MSRQFVAKLSHLFKSGRNNVEGRHTGKSELQSSSTADVSSVHVDKLIQQDRKITLHHTASQLELSYSSFQHTSWFMPVGIHAHENVWLSWDMISAELGWKSWSCGQTDVLTWSFKLKIRVCAYLSNIPYAFFIHGLFLLHSSMCNLFFFSNHSSYLVI